MYKNVTKKRTRDGERIEIKRGEINEANERGKQGKKFFSPSFRDGFKMAFLHSICIYIYICLS